MKNKKYYLILGITALIITVSGICIYVTNQQDVNRLIFNKAQPSGAGAKENFTGLQKDSAASYADTKDSQSFAFDEADEQGYLLNQDLYQEGSNFSNSNLSKDTMGTDENMDDSQSVENRANQQNTTEESNIDEGRHLNIQLWNPNKFAKNVYDAYDQHNNLSAEYFIDFDEAALKEIGKGDSFNLSLVEGNNLEVIVKEVEALFNDAVNYELTDASGNQRGSITQMDNLVEAIFISNQNQKYILRVIGGVGWVASEEELINNIKPKFLLKDDELQ